MGGDLCWFERFQGPAIPRDSGRGETALSSETERPAHFQRTPAKRFRRWGMELSHAAGWTGSDANRLRGNALLRCGETAPVRPSVQAAGSTGRLQERLRTKSVSAHISCEARLVIE